MKPSILIIALTVLLVSCSSSFDGFYNNHKADLGATSFQVPNFMKALLSSISTEVKHAIGNISDFKYIKFKDVNAFKRQRLIEEMNAVVNNGYTDVFRTNELTNTRIISVKEMGAVVTELLVFISGEDTVSAFYLQGDFDPDKIKSFTDEETFNAFSKDLMQQYQTNINPSFNPEN